jgi:hypothetical protein
MEQPDGEEEQERVRPDVGPDVDGAQAADAEFARRAHRGVAEGTFAEFAAARGGEFAQDFLAGDDVVELAAFGPDDEGQGHAGAESRPAAKHGRDRGASGSGWPASPLRAPRGLIATNVRRADVDIGGRFFARTT